MYGLKIRTLNICFRSKPLIPLVFEDQLFYPPLGAVDLSYVLETEVIYLDTEAFALKFSHSK